MNSFVVFTPAVIRSYPTTMEEISASATAICSGVQQELACTGDDGEVACCDPPPPPTQPYLPLSFPRSAPTLDYSSSGGCGDVCASVRVWANTEWRDRDMMGVRTLLPPSRCGREVFPASVRDGHVIPHDACPIHKKNKKNNREVKKEREQGEEFYSATFIFLLIFHLCSSLKPSLRRRFSGHVTDTPPFPVVFIDIGCLPLCRRLFFPTSGCISK